MRQSYRNFRRRYLPRKLKWKILDGYSLWRRIRSRDRANPDFVIVGAQKSGTTFLQSALSQSENVLPSAIKEVHYFDVNYSKGDDWYRSFFPSRREMDARHEQLGSKVITGEASPFYMYYPYAAARAHAFSPELRIIAVLRDPLERAISHYYHSKAWGFEPLPIEEAFAAEEARLVPERQRITADPNYLGRSFSNHSYVDRGHYARQLKEWEKYFPREQMLILDSRALFSDTQTVINRACEFLNIPAFIYEGGGSKNTTSGKKNVSQELRDQLAAKFAASNDELFDYTGIRF